MSRVQWPNFRILRLPCPLRASPPRVPRPPIGSMAGKTPPVGAAGPSLFDLFYGLASEARAQRIAAASALTSKALAAQADFEAAARVAQGGDGAAAIASDVQYTLSRLVKGLSSGRAAARPGFATALVELLRGVPAITTTAVYKLIQDTTRTAGSMKGHEERDAYFGRIFGFLALHRAGRLSVTSVSAARGGELFCSAQFPRALPAHTPPPAAPKHTRTLHLPPPRPGL